MRVKRIKDQVVLVMGAFSPMVSASLKIRMSPSPLKALARLVGRVTRLGRALGARTATGAIPAKHARRHVARAEGKRVVMAQEAHVAHGKRVRARRIRAKQA